MTIAYKVNIGLGLLTIILLGILTVLLLKAPTFILPSIYLAIMINFAVIAGSLIITGMIKLIFKRMSFLPILLCVLSFTSIAGIYKLMSPTLTIVVPKGYTGQVTLVLSNVNKNILTVDSNGIGYINKRTFNDTYTPPIVRETDGTEITSRCVGFNPTTFWAKGSSSSASTSTGQNISTSEIQYLSFEVVPKGKEGQKQYYTTDLVKYTDPAKLYRRE